MWDTSYELLVRRCVQTTETIQFTTIALACTQEVDVKTLFLKTSLTLGVKHRESKLELINLYP